MNLSIIIKIKYFDKHLDDCINSILSQNLLSTEIIFVSKKHNTQIDVFLLNIINKYSQKINLTIVQEDEEDFNRILNSAIKIAKGRYIHIINQNTMLLENTYKEFFKLEEEFNYDVIILDYIKISEDIPFSEVYKRYNKTIAKEKNKSLKKSQHYKDLIESGLVFNFTKYSKENNNKFFKKIKGLEYYSSNFFDSIQNLDPEYKIKILYEIDVQQYNLIFKRELLFENTYIFSDKVDLKLDIYLRLLLIKSISCLKNTAVGYYDNELELSNRNNKINDNIELNQRYNINLDNIIQNNKRRYKQIFDLYKNNSKLYANSFELIEYLVFDEILDFETKDYLLNSVDKQKYLKEILNYLEVILPNYKKNSYLNSSIHKKIKTKIKIQKLHKYLNQDLSISNEKKDKIETQKKIKLKKKKRISKLNSKKSKKEQKEQKEQKEHLREEHEKYKQKENKETITKKRKKQEKESINQDKDKAKDKAKEKEKEKTTKNKTKNNINFFSVLYRRIKIEINKIKRTRINKNIIQFFKPLKDSIKRIFLQIKTKIKNVFDRIFKRKDKNTLLISETKVLLLSSGETKKETVINTEKTKVIKNKK